MVRLLFIPLITAIFFIFIKENGGKIEGQLFPVTSEVYDLRIEVTGTNEITIWGTFDLYRAKSCDFAGLEFLLNGPDRSVVIPWNSRESQKVRENGPNDFGPWDVQMTRNQFITAASVTAFHRCGPIYLTQTEFFHF